MLLRLLAAFLIVISGYAFAGDDGWVLARDRDGIKVWTRDIPDYPIRGFKAVMTVNSSLRGLVNLILDTDNASRWVYRTNRIQLLKRDTEAATFIIRVETDFPWPLSDRDVVLDGKIVQDTKTGAVTIQSHSVDSVEYPKRPDFVRMPDMQGTWIFRPLGKDLVEVTMLGRADPGGNIPAGIVNLIIQETPYRTMQRMREVLTEPKYQNTPLPQIREPGFEQAQ